MSLSLSREMTTTLTSALTSLEITSVNQVRRFILSQINSDGGFCGRDSESDLYYTLFGVECLTAFGIPFPEAKILNYLKQFGAGENLDFVHLICLIRCLAKLSKIPLDENLLNRLLENLKPFQFENGLFRQTVDSKSPSLYAGFLAALAFEEIGVVTINQAATLKLIEQMKTSDYAFADQEGVEFGTTPVTAAVVGLLAKWQQPIDPKTVAWLLAREAPDGGFLAIPEAPVADLLSTATTLFALKVMNHSFQGISENIFDFVENLWHENGGFFGNVLDKTPDCEYTFYGLLSIGVLTEILNLD